MTARKRRAYSSDPVVQAARDLLEAHRWLRFARTSYRRAVRDTHQSRWTAAAVIWYGDAVAHRQAAFDRAREQLLSLAQEETRERHSRN